ncbi:polysaccharide biosynthesis/export family protein [Novosphingobium profundi]|uniref:polysaccharide biosynthesis/export family protein n=1 Tax=Novosphingobium profundi TaxID=1774954 RepID=UPI001CFCC347|nr:polysaccharide biosynthesis/export family protein [Novosphingobium profundi]
MQKTKTLFPVALMLSGLALTGCSHTTSNPNLPVGEAAYRAIPETVVEPSEYLVRPLDVLSVTVFGEPDLTLEEVFVSETGSIQFPLAGALKVEGMEVGQISDVLAQRLAAKYLVDPQVTVSVTKIAPRYASVEGEVEKPGVYEINADASLLSTIARAESPTSTAKLDEIVVLRSIGDEHLVARFNLKDIRTGVSPDPHIIDGDVIMVGFSIPRGLLEDILKAAPLFNAWSRY